MKLNLGCGKDIKKDFVNIDIKEGYGVDIVTDINEDLPFEDNSIEYIYTSNVLEHLDNPIHFIKECHRIMKPGSEMYIKIPFYNSANAYSFHHKTIFRPDWYKLFTEERGHEDSLDSWDYPVFKIVKVDYIPTSRGKYVPFKRFFCLMIGELYKSQEIILKKCLD